MKLTVRPGSCAFGLHEKVVVYGDITKFQMFPHVLVKLVFRKEIKIITISFIITGVVVVS